MLLRGGVQTLVRVNLTTRGPGIAGVETAAVFDLPYTNVGGTTASPDRLHIQLESLALSSLMSTSCCREPP